MLRTCTFAFGDTQFLLEIFLFHLHFLSFLLLFGPLQRYLEFIGRLLSCDFDRAVEHLGQAFALPVRFFCFLHGGFVGEVAHFLEFADFTADFAFGDVVFQSAEDVLPFVTVADLGAYPDGGRKDVVAPDVFAPFATSPGGGAEIVSKLEKPKICQENFFHICDRGCFDFERGCFDGVF